MIDKEKQNLQTKKIDNNFLLEQQKQTLKTFLEKGILTKEQYEYSLGCLLKKMKL